MKATLLPAAALSLSALITLTACDGDASGESPATPDTTLTVFAAASLADAFAELAEGFEADHPGVAVEFNIAGSSTLAQQITAGAPADVFVSADEVTMDRVVEEGQVVGSPAVVATNELTLVTPAGNPADISSLRDAAAEGVKLVVCAPQVPCGRAAATQAEHTGVRLSPVSEETQVTDVLGKVVSGEADAGLVYVTDAAGAGDAVESIALEHSATAVNRYPAAVLHAAEDSPEQAALAQAFVDYVTSEDGQSLLEDHGFGSAH